MLSVSPSIGLVAHVGPAGFGERAGWVPRDGVLGRPREAIATPIILLICVTFMSTCRRRYCCGGFCIYYWFNCTGACKHMCGGEKLISGREPATGLQPDEEATDPDVILGDEDHYDDDDDEQLCDPPLPGRCAVPAPPSTASEMSDEENGGAGMDSLYNKDQKRCCDGMAACLENAEDGELQEANGYQADGPAMDAVRKSKNRRGGRKK